MTSATPVDPIGFEAWLEIQELPVVNGRKVVSSYVLEKNAHAIQNAFVSLIASEDAALNPELRFAHLAFRYDGEVQNGGHLQFFTNLVSCEGVEIVESRTQETMQALLEIRAGVHANILKLASERWLAQTRKSPTNVDEYCERALTAEFDDLDSRYYNSSPTVMDHLEERLRENEAQFITRLP